MPPLPINIWFSSFKLMGEGGEVLRAWGKSWRRNAPDPKRVYVAGPFKSVAVQWENSLFPKGSPELSTLPPQRPHFERKLQNFKGVRYMAKFDQVCGVLKWFNNAKCICGNAWQNNRSVMSLLATTCRVLLFRR